MYAVGWGFTESNFYKGDEPVSVNDITLNIVLIIYTNLASDTLNQVKFQIQTQNTCGLAYLPVLQFCAGNPSLGKDTCNVDYFI